MSTAESPYSYLADELRDDSGLSVGAGEELLTLPAPPKPKAPRPPSKKMREALAAEYQRGVNAGRLEWQERDRAPEGLGVALLMGLATVVGFALGAWIF